VPMWTNILTTIAASGVIGGYIDFWLGKKGAKRVRELLEDWWLRLGYVRLGNFGREETLFAVNVMDFLFGRSLFSKRRLVSCGAVALACVVLLISPGIFPLLQSQGYHQDSCKIIR